MLHQIGLNSAADLFDPSPEELRLNPPLDTSAALSEIELLADLSAWLQTMPASRRATF